MRESYWGYWLVILGVFVIGVMLLVNNMTTNNTQDYYNIKEVTQSAMVDAIDFSYLRLYGNIKISETKFVENFYRRFAENVNGANIYDIDFYDIYEVPPKVSVKISSGTKSFNIGNSNNSYDTVTTMSAILEMGATGEKTEITTTDVKKKKVCTMNISTPLLKYFQGQPVKVGSKTYTLAEDLKNSKYHFQVSSEALEKVKSITDNNEFKKWFNHNVFITSAELGTVDAKTYLSKTGYDKLDDIFKAYKDRKWINIGS